MTTFDKREMAFETKFALDAEMQFKAEARRSKLLGLWAAALLNKTGAHALEYAQEVVKADCESSDDEDVYRKVAGDLRDRADEPTIRAKMVEMMTRARIELLDEHS